MILLSGFIYGQALQKEYLVGVHAIEATLKPGVTLEQYFKEYSEKVIPIFKIAYPEWQVYITKSLRGDVAKEGYGLIFIIKSEKDRDKYFNPNGSPNELGNTAEDKINKGLETIKRFGTFETTYTDWIVL